MIWCVFLQVYNAVAPPTTSYLADMALARAATMMASSKQVRDENRHSGNMTQLQAMCGSPLTFNLCPL